MEIVILSGEANGVMQSVVAWFYTPANAAAACAAHACLKMSQFFIAGRSHTVHGLQLCFVAAVEARDGGGDGACGGGGGLGQER